MELKVKDTMYESLFESNTVTIKEVFDFRYDIMNKFDKDEFINKYDIMKKVLYR